MILTVAVAVLNEEKILRRAVKDADIQSYVPYYYRIPKCTVPVSQANRPVIVGFGPAGMFAALVLAKAGLRPIVLERGKRERQEDVTNFENGVSAQKAM
ncbi:MAG: FAD-dependent monooxygenase [Ruminococcus callidus]